MINFGPLHLLLISAVACNVLRYQRIAWERWLHDENPIYTRVYFFNMTNFKDVEQGTEPKYKELGPYTFEEKRKKTILSRDAAEGAITYDEKRSYVFRAELSSGSKQDRFCYIQEVTKCSGNVIIRSLFPSTLSQFSYRCQSFESRRVDKVKRVCKGVEEMLFTNRVIFENQRSSYHFGVLDQGLDDKVELREVFTGIHDRYRLGKVKKWFRKGKLTDWRHDRCNRITGTDGLIFPAGVKQNDTLWIFAPWLRRSIPFKFLNVVKYNKLRANRFAIAESGWESPTLNPANRCYCLDPNWSTGFQCVGGGLIPLHSVGLYPLLYSQPHFHSGKALEIQQIKKTLNSSWEQHENYIIIEPQTGLVLESKDRRQLNVVYGDGESRNGDKSSITVNPLFWFERTMTLPIDQMPVFTPSPWEVESKLWIKGFWVPKENHIHGFRLPGGYTKDSSKPTFICRMSSNHTTAATLIYNPKLKESYRCDIGLNDDSSSEEDNQYDILVPAVSLETSYTWVTQTEGTLNLLDGIMLAGMTSDLELLFICRVNVTKPVITMNKQIRHVVYLSLGILRPSSGECETHFKEEFDTYNQNMYELLQYVPMFY